MPFTVAHAAAALPLHRWLGRFSVLSALVIGCCIPDLPYFLPLGIPRDVSHSKLGLIYYSLPMGLAVYFAFHAWFKQPLFCLLPPRIATRLAPFAFGATRFPIAHGLAIALCLLLGAVSHLCWDAFTHGDGAVVRALAFLRQPLFTIGTYTAYGYSLAQHASSLFGIAVLWISGSRWLALAPEHDSPLAWPAGRRYAVLLTIAAAACVVLAILVQQHLPSDTSLPRMPGKIGAFLIRTLQSLGLATILYAMAWQWWRRRLRPGQAPPMT